MSSIRARASTSPRTYGGDVDHRWLERSYHVATLDYDRDDIIAAAVEFALRLTAAGEPAEPGLGGAQGSPGLGGAQG